VALPEGTPTWPEFTADTNQFLELNSKTMKVITTPNKERLDKLTGSLQQAVKLQRDADQSPVSTGINYWELIFCENHNRANELSLWAINAG